MPDHLHMLVEGTSETSDVRRFMKIAKQRSGARFANAGAGPLWQEGYFDRVLRREDDSRAIARYIMANPVRAGLVDSVIDYPYSGSSVWTLTDLVEGL